MKAPRWQRVTVVGCGLIGASFALALRQKGACARLAGWDAAGSVLDEALARGVIDEVDTAFASGEVCASELVYLAMPVGEIIEFLGARGPQLGPGSIITDAGSTKAEICRAARAHLPENVYFVGGHPIAGSHHSGLLHARADLFEGAPYVLTPVSGEDRAVEAVKETVELLGARVTLMAAGEHDRAMAFISHLPQLLASALAATVRDQPDASALAALSGPGYRDMTRLAASSWDVWRGILMTNPAPIADALGQFIEKLTRVRDALPPSSDSASDLATLRALFQDEPSSGRTVR